LRPSGEPSSGYLRSYFNHYDSLAHQYNIDGVLARLQPL